VSFTLLVLVTALFVRSTNELRMAERTIQNQQAFWLAEASLDRGLYEILYSEPTQLIVSDKEDEACTQPPAFGADPRVLSLSANQTTSYKVCRMGTNSYEVNGDGTKLGTTQRTELLTGEMQRVTPEIKFAHTIYTANPMVLRGGVIDGSLATSAEDKDALQLLDHSALKGNIFLPSGRDAEALKLSDSMWVDPDGRAWVDPAGNPVTNMATLIQELKMEPMGDLIPIRVPNPINWLQGAEASPHILSYTNFSPPCIQAGTWYVKGINLTNSELCTYGGPVELYVKGDITVTNSWLYGQPAKDALGHPITQGVGRLTGQVTPENLRIFALPDKPKDGPVRDTITLEGNGTTAAAIYAPDMRVIIRNGYTLKGAVISKTATIDRGGAAGLFGGMALYDPALNGKPIKHSPNMARVDVKAWGMRGQGETFQVKNWVEVLPTSPGGGFSGISTGYNGGCGGGGC